MVPVSDRYTVTETLRKNDRFVLQRGVRVCDGRPVLLKRPAAKHPFPETVRQLKHEQDIGQTLEPGFVLRPLALDQHADRLTLVLEDFPGVSLRRFLGAPMDIGRFLRVAIETTAAVEKLHEHDLIHKDMRPDNILVDIETCQVRLTDLGLASLLPREHQRAVHPNLIEGSLAYMSPEQTGRMNRAVDYRTDLYSLGITLYEMLTGELPCRATDPLDWVHCHVARAPRPPEELAPATPKILSAIVLRLLSKVAEDRYQTARGLKHDLEACLEQWELTGQLRPFPLGEGDVSERFQVPQRLYGRDREIEALQGSFARVVATGLPELVLVSGYSGIGKSSLVHELHKPIVAAHGLFVSGKFDQQKRDVPFATVVQAFIEIIRQVLAETEDRIARVRDELARALGSNAQLIIELIPQLELIVGPQPAVAPLPLTEERNRFFLVFQRFLGAFASDEHPLALFLDDLQWADAGSLALLQHLITHPDVRNVLLIGAYRDNEVCSTHPLSLMLDEIRASGVRARSILLAPLSSKDLERLVADAVHCDAERARPLSVLVEEKTHGNPFFVLQFLMALVQRALVTFDRATRSWTWDLRRIEAEGYTDNVVDLMVDKVNRLAPATRAALTLAACVGNEVDSGTLAALDGTTAEEVHRALWEALREGLMIRLGDTYRFMHDRVQQAGYLLIPEGERVDMHLAIGRALLATMSPEELEERVFDVVNQLNLGSPLVSDPGETARLVEMNLQAGRRAKASTAYTSAISYLSAGRRLLDRAPSSTPDALAYELHYELAASTYLSGDHEHAAELLSALFERAKTPLQKAAIRRLEVDLYTSRDELGEAVARGVQGLSLLGIVIPPHPTWEEVLCEYERVWQLLGDRPIEGLLDLPSMTDPELCAAQGILAVLFAPALNFDRSLPLFIYCRMVNISLVHGNSDASALAYTYFGMRLGPEFGRYTEGYRFGKLGYDLMDRRRALTYKAKIILLFGDNIVCWTRHLENDLAYVNSAFQTALENGDVTFACYCCNALVADRLILGHPLDEVFEESERRAAFTRKARFDASTQTIVGIQRLILNMRGRTAHFATFSGPDFDEDAYEAVMDRYPWSIVTCWYYVMKLEARVLSGDFDQAVASAARARERLWTSLAHIPVVEYWYFGALALAAIHDREGAAERPAILEAVREHEEKLAGLAQTCPANFANKHALVAAELARIEDRPLDAMRLYEDAARSARENGYIQNEAIANETAARFYLGRGLPTAATAYLREAKQGYAQWGADGKVAQIEQRYGHLLEPRPAQATAAIVARAEQLDLMAALQASQAISREIVLSRLLETLVRTVVQQAGAQKGFLLLARSSALRIEAEARSGPSGIEVLLEDRELSAAAVPESVIAYARRSRERVIMNDAAGSSRFSSDPYIEAQRPRSLLCLPILRQTELLGVLYLENNLIAGAFTHERLTVVELLASQAAISLQNAMLYADLEQASHVIGSSPTVLFRWQPAPELIAVYVSDNVSSVLRHRPCDLLSGAVTFSSLVHPGDRERASRQIEAAAADGRDRVEQEYRVVCGDGRVLWVDDRTAIERDAAGRICHYRSIVTDITERKAADDARRRSEELLHAIVDNTTAVIYAKDLEGRFLKVNPPLEAMLQIPQEELIGKTDLEVFPKEFADAYRMNDLKVLSEGTPVEWEETAPQADGIHTYVSIKVPLYDAAGVPYGICGISTDITHRVEAEKERARLLKEAQEALQLREEFLSVASHELRTPLTPLRLQIQLLQRHLQESALASHAEARRFHKLLQMSMHHVDRLRKLVDDLLDVSRISAGQLELQLGDVDLSALVTETVAGFDQELSAAGSALSVCASEPVVGRWDRSRIEQVVVNLLANAMKYGAGAPISVGVQRKGALAELWVEDRGIGIPKQAQDRIFGRFERATSIRSFGGLGLGLFITRRIVEAHRGTVRVLSAPGEGATFTVELPIGGP